MLQLLKRIFGGKNIDYKALTERGVLIIDVRTPSEFNTGHIKGSLNIPADTIRQRTAEIKNRNKPVITVCLSGARSAMAKSVLSAAGIEAYNGGPWRSLLKKL